jgi:hypothetical protein
MLKMKMFRQTFARLNKEQGRLGFSTVHLGGEVSAE